MRRHLGLGSDGVRTKDHRTKGHHRRNFVMYFDEVYNELCACLNRNLVGLQPTTLITRPTQHHVGPMQFSQAEHKSN